jgi:hypothetical protein
MDYLAGRIDRSEFEGIVNPGWPAQLRKWLDQGKSIETVSVNPSLGEDDDGLLIRFGDHDPATSAFRVPKKRGLEIR